jgi:hypothetical protein
VSLMYLLVSVFTVVHSTHLSHHAHTCFSTVSTCLVHRVPSAWISAPTY